MFGFTRTHCIYIYIYITASSCRPQRCRHFLCHPSDPLASPQEVGCCILAPSKNLLCQDKCCIKRKGDFQQCPVAYCLILELVNLLEHSGLELGSGPRGLNHSTCDPFASVEGWEVVDGTTEHSDPAQR